MERLIDQIQIKVNQGVYLKDPSTSELGKNIICNSIILIDKIGFEMFTFRKLAKELKTTESSIYRYFENKHKLLIYLTSWYWAWMEYRLVFSTINVSSPVERLNTSIKLVLKSPQRNESFDFLNLQALYRIVISESPKSYLIKEVDDANKVGSYSGYKRLVERISQIVIEIKPQYKYPQMLISTIIEGAHFQQHFAEHLPRLTNKLEGEDSITDFYLDIANKALL